MGHSSKADDFCWTPHPARRGKPARAIHGCGGAPAANGVDAASAGAPSGGGAASVARPTDPAVGLEIPLSSWQPVLQLGGRHCVWWGGVAGHHGLLARRACKGRVVGEGEAAAQKKIPSLKHSSVRT